MKRRTVVAAFVVAVALVLGSHGTVGSASEKGSPQLSKEFRAAATEAFARLEILRSAACIPAGNAYDQAESQAGKAMDKAEKQARLEPDRALMKNLYGYSTHLALARIADLTPHADADQDTCRRRQKMADEAEDRPRLMKALGLDEAAAARLVEKLPHPNAREALDQWAALVDTSNGMFKRAVAVAKKLETWYEINPDNPDAQALEDEWCGNQEALNQKIHELAAFWDEHGTTLEAALSHSGMDVDSILALGDAMKEGTGLITALRSERRRLEGMGCICK
jgi:thiol-disulfide isomerase/thioredoxin